MEATSDRASPSSRGHCYASLPVGPVDRAVTYARLAAERAVQQLAYEEGARLYDMALRALAGAPDGMERMELLLALGDAQSRAGETEVAKATFIEAADLARQIGDVERLAVGRARLQRALRVDARRIRHEDHPAASRGARCTSRRGQRAPGAAAPRLAGARRDDWDMRPRDELSAEAVVIAEAIGDPATLAYALISRAMATWGPRAAFDMRVLAERAMGSRRRPGIRSMSPRRGSTGHRASSRPGLPTWCAPRSRTTCGRRRS